MGANEMKKLIVEKTNEIHWFIIGAVGYLIYKELFIDRPWDIIDLIAAPFFGMIPGVLFYRWIADK